MSVNKAILIGHLGKDPNVTLAKSQTCKDKNGEKQEKTESHNIVFYKRLAEIAGEYLKKGSQIYVEGRITTEKWQTKEGQDRYTTKIVANEMKMLDRKSSGGSFEVVENKPAASSAGAAPARTASATKGSFDNFDDDIPF